jgi:uncharacterized protein (DUF488 family)
MHSVYTTGYEGFEPPQFIGKLIIHGIRTIIDVREKPLSRKNGFRKSVLYAYLKKNNINYHHLGELGSPSKIRYKLYADKNYDDFFSSYSKYLKTQKLALNKLVKILETNPTCCLMCFEKDYKQCHRKILAEYLRNIGFEIKHV